MADENDDVVIEADGSEELGGKGADAGAKVAKLKAELEQARKEKQEYLDGWQRAKADYVNALKRFETDKLGAIEIGKVVAVRNFIPTMDSLERAEAAGEVPEAFKGIAKQLHDAAKALGLEKFGAIGDAFDPNLHEALGQDTAAEESKDETVSAVLEPGWKSKEAIVRPAKVRVARFEA